MADEQVLELIDHLAYADEIVALGRSDPREFRAVLNARRLLAEQGLRLGYPHTSAIRGSALGLRELRPRAGRSAYRPIFRRFGDRIVLLALTREAVSAPRRFARGVAAAEARARVLLETAEGGNHV